MPLEEFDSTLINRCLNHEEGSWPDFVDRYLSLIHHVIRHTAFCRSISLKPADEDDIAAEILLDLTNNDYHKLRQFKGNSSFPAYLTVITRRACVRRLIKLRRETALGHVQAHRSSIENSSSTIEPILSTEEVHQVLGSFEANHAEVIQLYHFEFQSYQEIARKTGITEETIAQIIGRARRRILISSTQNQEPPQP